MVLFANTLGFSVTRVLYIRNNDVRLRVQMTWSFRVFTKIYLKHMRGVITSLKSFPKRFNSRFTASEIVIQVIGTGASGTPKSLAVLTNRKNYLFNCGEGTARLLNEHGIPNIDNCFVTHPSLNNTSGLPGIRNLTLHGPPNINNLFTSFVFTKGPNTKIRVDFDSPIEDDAFRIESVPIFAKKNHLPAFINQGSLNSTLLTAKNKKKKSRKSEKSVRPTPNEPDISLVYICSPRSTPETYDEVFIIIECPNEDFLDSLLESEKFAKLEQTVQLIVHLTPNDVLKRRKYADWMSRFPAATRHLVVNETCSGLANVAAYRLQFKLNAVDSEMFPLLKTKFELPESCLVGSENVVLARPLLRYFIRPRIGFDWSGVVELEPEKCLEEVGDIQSWRESSDRCLQRGQFPVKSDLEYPQVIFVGTGSYLPTVMRNVSCTLLKTNDHKCLILDCGEGTYGQILRFFGPTETTKILKNISAIFISHLHFDHFGGLAKILHERQQILANENTLENPLFLLAPPHIEQYLTSHPDISPIALISNLDLRYGQRQMMNAQYRALLQRSGLLDICTVKVNHNIQAFGVVLTLSDGSKIVYTGDTAPCDRLIEVGKKSDLLIHEATMPDLDEDKPHAKYHSTVSQAIEIGRRMDVRFTMLTHFGSQHAPVPSVSDNYHNVGVAFDNMMVPLCNLGLLPMIKPTLESLFRDYDEKLTNYR